MNVIYVFRIVVFFLAVQSTAIAKQYSIPCEEWPTWARSICSRPYQTWTQGKDELYLSGYAWHNRVYYNKKYLNRFNEQAWGGGLGKSFYDENGNWHGLYAFAFLDSHQYLEPIIGYAFLKTLPLNENARIGAGYALLVTQRPDIFHGIPFPGALPWVSISYKRASLSATYIPGARNAGNVLFILGKFLL